MFEEKLDNQILYLYILRFKIAIAIILRNGAFLTLLLYILLEELETSGGLVSGCTW